MFDEEASKTQPQPHEAPAAPSKRKGRRRVLASLALAALLAAATTGTAAYYLLALAGSSTAHVASAGSYQVTPAKTPAAAVQGEVIEYEFDVQADDPQTKFTYTVAVEPAATSTVGKDGVKYRLWQKKDGAETEIRPDSNGLFKDESLMNFNLGTATQTHRYVLRAISNTTGKLDLDVTVTATQAKA